MERAEIERLREFIDTAKQPGDLPWARIECDVADWLAQHGDELLRLALLGKRVEGAPVATVRHPNGNPSHIECDILTMLSFPHAKRVALVGVD